MPEPEKEPKPSVWQEFRTFAIKGNVIDLTVGVVIGAAFGKIVNSIVEDIVMPPIGALLGRMDFANMYILIPGQEDKIKNAGKPLKSIADYKAAGVATFNYGQFLTNVVQFVIIAFAVFFLVRAINRLRVKLGEELPVDPRKRDCPFCLSSVPEAATKCSFCTSELPPISVEEIDA